MELFTLALPDGRSATGLTSFPTLNNPRPKGLPLIVAIHGGTYTADYYNADEERSIHVPSLALGLPVVAVNRPGYAGVPALPPIPKESSFIQQHGEYLHAILLPAVWKKFGSPRGATSIVLHTHSIGSGVGIVAAALHGLSPSTALYPLSGLITSGIGTQFRETGPNQHRDSVWKQSEELKNGDEVPATYWPVDVKDQEMLRPQWGLCDLDVIRQSERLNHPLSILEMYDIGRLWQNYWKEKYAPHVKVRHLYCLAEFDNFWNSTQDAVNDYARFFQNSAGLETAVMRNAPHCIELSYMGPAWYAKSFGFAMECAVADALRKEGKVAET